MMRSFYRTIICFIFSATVLAAYAQDEIEGVIAGSAVDANYLAKGFVSPFLKVIATGVNQGWYNTAKPHKTLGVDLTITVSPVFVPNSDLLYEVDNNQLKNIKLTETHTGTVVGPTGKAQVPTLFGPEKSPTYIYSDPTNVTNFGQTFSGPEGLGLADLNMQAVPIPMAHLGVGIYKGTDLKFRFVPTINLGDDTQLNMFGIGVMHDVKQWIPGIKNLPFDLSGFFGYTKFRIESQLDRPDQKAEFDVTGTTIQALISKKFSVLTVYGGLGYNIAKSTVVTKGLYDLDENGSYETKDPVNIEGKATGPRATAGLRLKLAIFTFHGDYTVQKYKTLSFGFGLAIR